MLSFQFSDAFNKWYVCALMSVLAFQQSMFWTAFSPIFDDTQAFYNTSVGVVNMLYTYGYMVIIPLTPFLGYTYTSPPMLKLCFLVSVGFSTVGGVIRCLSLISPKADFAVYLLSFGQILNAVAGVIVLAAPPTFSSIWFPPHERTLATALMLSASNFGSAAIFAVAPYLLAALGYSWYLIIQALHGVLLLAVVLTHFPVKPLEPPSMTSVTSDFSILLYFQDAKNALKNGSFVILAFVGSLQMGLIGGWEGMLDVILIPQNFDEKLIGWFGFAQIFCVAFGTCVMGYFGDTLFKRKYKWTIIILLFVANVYMIIFSLCFPLFGTYRYYPILSSGPWLVGVIILGTGFLYGCAIPLYYELSVELTFPINSSVSASIITIILNIVATTFLIVGDYIPPRLITGVVTFFVMLGCFALLPTSEKYTRLDIDEHVSDVETIVNAETNES